MNDLPTYILDRVFDAPRALVWRTWTEAELLGQWYGPGVETVIHELDVRPGGLWLNEMKMKQGSGYQRVEYLEVEPQAKLVWLHANADANWNVASNPMMPDWPRVLMTVVTFEEKDGQTHMRLTWTPHEASEAEIACFRGAMAGLDSGWGAGMELLANMLVDLQT
ncbi:SRPBCC domain-containing protein [Aestuariibius sp. HNIBRBA575]|uniref:SRPBCC family protein n=1 Tax=Aestuariibius sp. HNIBRBA575 TaxID=3233343 RepID=UPI0034A50E76